MLRMSGEILRERGLKTRLFLGPSIEYCEGPYGMDRQGLYGKGAVLIM